MCDFIYLCPICGSCFSTENSLQEHDVAVHSSKHHACLMCHNALKDLTLLGRQVTAHKNLLQCCNICGDLRENKVDLYIHVTTSHKYGGKLVCDLCSKTFSTDSSLKVHCINEHATEMPYVMQKYESFCNVHSSQKLEDCRLDVLKDSINPSDACLLHPEEKGSRDETSSPCDVSTSNQPILQLEAVDGTGRPYDCPGSALTELQISYQEQFDKDWYTTSTDHMSSIIQPNDILERVQPFTENNESQQIECSLCGTTFSNRNDYLLAHYRKDHSNVCPDEEEKRAGLQDLVEFRQSSTGNTPHVPSKKRVMEEFSDNETVVSHQDKNASAAIDNDQLEPDGTFLTKTSALTIQTQNKNASVVINQNDQLELKGTLFAEISTFKSQIYKNKSIENQNDQIQANDTLLAKIPALTIQTQNNASAINQNDPLEPNGTLLADISALTIQNKLNDDIVSNMNKSLSDSNYCT